MVDSLIYGVGAVTFLIFFAADMFLAYTLHNLKKLHPAIDDSSPAEDFGGGLDAGDHAYLNSASKMAKSSSQERSLDEAAIAAGSTRSATLSAASTLAHAVNQNATLKPILQEHRPSDEVMHKVVIGCSVAAPVIFLLQLVAPTSLGWMFIGMPDFLGYFLIIPGFCLSLFYVIRVSHVAQMYECTKSQWLSAMWFRLDVVCVMAVILFFGWGDWVVATCLIIVDIYLAKRLLVTEKNLLRTMHRTQLLPEDEMPSSTAAFRATNVDASEVQVLRGRVDVSGTGHGW